ncbi:MAG: RNA 3'-terminal phosphate cyclase [bacterium]|nr:RNA 3'-terminal phosphate cyclase [bacterium]
MLTIDGSHGEGGGQILRTALCLSLVTGIPFRIDQIRANRSRPGLRKQHLTAVQAATSVGAAETTGSELNSCSLSFAPTDCRGGNYRFEVGSAGSANLVLHTVLPALLTADEPSRVEVIGGTHNPGAPPFEHLDLTYLDMVHRLGGKATATLNRAGFYPRGGGRAVVNIEPCDKLTPTDLLNRGALRRISVNAMVAGLPRHIAQREIATVTRNVSVSPGDHRLVELDESWGPGNAVTIVVEHDSITEVFTGFGRRGIPAETVALEAVEEFQCYLESGAVVGPHTGDQLLLLTALAGQGRFTVSKITSHLTTAASVIEQFLPVTIHADSALKPPSVTITSSTAAIPDHQ